MPDWKHRPDSTGWWLGDFERVTQMEFFQLKFVDRKMREDIESDEEDVLAGARWFYGPIPGYPTEHRGIIDA